MDSGGCIENATVQIVSGQRQGETHAQKTPCGWWDYDGGVFLSNLTPGVSMTFRASAPGWTTEEKTFMPVVGSGTAVGITLFPVQ